MEINLLKYLTLKRTLNIIKVISSFGISKIIHKPVVWGMPITYSIEPTNHCNLQCPECPSGLGALTRPLGLLSINDFCEIINQIKDSGFYLQLFFQGEPYINKSLPEMIKYAQSKNVYVSVSTNGHFITEKTVNDVVENAPDKVTFSMDGLDEESYKNYRVGGSFQKANEGLRLLIKKRNELKKKIPFVEFQFIVMRQNEHMLDDVIKYGKNVGVDKVVFKTMQVSSYENAVRFLPSDQKYSRYIIKDGSVKIKSKLKDHCFALWRTSVITWDGTVVPCCFDKDADFKLGGLKENSMKDIWLSESYHNFRQGVLENRKGLSMCTNCTEGLKMNILEMEH